MQADLSGRLVNGLVTGAAGALATTAVIAAWGQAKTGSPWTPFNAVSHMIFGENAANRDGFVPRETLIGLGLNATALVTWGVLYEAIAGNTPLPASLATGTVATGVIYALDYHILPERLRPGFEKRLGGGAIVAAYTALALVFGLSPLWRRTP